MVDLEVIRNLYNEVSEKTIIRKGNEVIRANVNPKTIEQLIDKVENVLKVNRDDAIYYIFNVIETEVIDFIADVSIRTDKSNIRNVSSDCDSVSEYISKYISTNLKRDSGVLEITRDDIIEMYSIICNKHSECTPELIGAINLIIVGKLEKIIWKWVEKF